MESAGDGRVGSTDVDIMGTVATAGEWDDEFWCPSSGRVSHRDVVVLDRRISREVRVLARRLLVAGRVSRVGSPGLTAWRTGDTGHSAGWRSRRGGACGHAGYGAARGVTASFVTQQNAIATDRALRRGGLWVSRPAPRTGQLDSTAGSRKHSSAPPASAQLLIAFPIRSHFRPPPRSLCVWLDEQKREQSTTWRPAGWCLLVPGVATPGGVEPMQTAVLSARPVEFAAGRPGRGTNQRDGRSRSSRPALQLGECGTISERFSPKFR